MERLKELCSEIDVLLDDNAIKRFEIYMKLVLEWNEKINLTSITDTNEFIIKHFYDSLTLMKYLKIKDGNTVIDIGTGAGFPGVPLLIAKPDIKLTLLDSLNKRIIFLSDVVLPELGLNAKVIHGRAEDYSKLQEYREQYDFAVSRAVANLAALSEYCIPFVKVGGCFAAMKGPDSEDEIKQSLNAVNTLGGKLSETYNFELPNGSKRTIAVIGKKRHTSEKYPRRGVKINKNPL